MRYVHPLGRNHQSWRLSWDDVASVQPASDGLATPIGHMIDHSFLPLGFYIDSNLFPSSRSIDRVSTHSSRLLLGPFCGKPACQFINTAPGKARGVCADAFLQRQTLVVPEVDKYPGHIACDGETKSEIVCPLVSRVGGDEIVLGVLDLDCLALAGFDQEDKFGLEKIVALIVAACDW